MFPLILCTRQKHKSWALESNVDPQAETICFRAVQNKEDDAAPLPANNIRFLASLVCLRSAPSASVSSRPRTPAVDFCGSSADAVQELASGATAEIRAVLTPPDL